METSVETQAPVARVRLELPVEFRPVKPEDMSLVMDSWLKSFRGSPWAGVVTNHTYYDIYRVTIEQLLARGAKLLIAHVPGKPDMIMGYLCYEELKNDETAVHYLYVKDPYRRRQIAARLIKQVHKDNEKPLFYTFKTSYSKHFRARHVPEIARRK